MLWLNKKGQNGQMASERTDVASAATSPLGDSGFSGAAFSIKELGGEIFQVSMGSKILGCYPHSRTAPLRGGFLARRQTGFLVEQKLYARRGGPGKGRDGLDAQGWHLDFRRSVYQNSRS